MLLTISISFGTGFATIDSRCLMELIFAPFLSGSVVGRKVKDRLKDNRRRVAGL